MKRVHKKFQAVHEKAGERGAIIIELALIMPFLVVLFAIIIDLGLLVREHQIMQNAAREGARFSSLPQNCISCRPVNCSECVGGCDASNCKTQAEVLVEIQNRIIAYLAQEGITITSDDIIVSQSEVITINGVNSTASQVTVSYDRALLLNGAPLLPGGDVTLSGRATFMNLF